MRNTKNKLQALLLALVIQAAIAGLIFWGGLLDPLLGLWGIGIYFFAIGSYLMYRYLLSRLFNKEMHSGYKF